MTNHRPTRRRNSISGQFSARTIQMMEAPSWSVLSLAARLVLDRIEIEHAHHGGNDNGRLPVTFDQFVEYGVHRHSSAPLYENCALSATSRSQNVAEQATENGGDRTCFG
jgi:hypothetical protein